MFPFLVAVLAGSAQAAVAADVHTANLPRLFEAACLDGQAKLSAGEVTAISFDQLPSDLRDRLGRPASGKVWQLNASGRSYLYILDYDAASGASPKICGVASDAMDLNAGADALAARVAGGMERSGQRSAQWLNAKDGYVATATTASQFKVLQISWMSEAQKSAALARVRQLPH